MGTQTEYPEPGDGHQPAPAWYSKFFEYWRNRNRVGPSKVELPDCDFFIVGPRRTLRVLRPPVKRETHYEALSNRPESINDNLLARWSRRPHSSGNCRCSFRQSNRLSSTEEKILSDELNRIRTSLCEAEITGQDIDELEETVSKSLQKLQAPLDEPKPQGNGNFRRKSDEGGQDPSREGQKQAEEQTVKNRIVKDLERYINVLLEEILDDTVKFIAGSEAKCRKRAKRKARQQTNGEKSQDRNSKTEETKLEMEEEEEEEEEEEQEEGEKDNTFNHISFSFLTSDRIRREQDQVQDREKEGKDPFGEKGYVNPAFIGSARDPDSLDYYLKKEKNLETEVDSGINSVETMEFQQDQEPSLEQSLLRIIDEKLGRAPQEDTWKNSPEQENQVQGQSLKEEEREPIPEARRRGRRRNEGEATISPEFKLGVIEPDNLKEMEETTNEPSFEKLRLEFKNPLTLKVTPGEKDPSGGGGGGGSAAVLEGTGNRAEGPWKEKTRVKTEVKPIELRAYRKNWPEVEGTGTAAQEPIGRDFVTFRKNKKPVIVFLHGFGSSAEVFQHQLMYFSALGYPCVAPDMLGHGMSSAPDRKRDYHFSKLLKDLDVLLQHYAFRPGQKCVLVAHNYGCSFAAALACKYDSNIHQLVLISGGGPTPLAPPSTESAGRCCLRAMLTPFLMCGLHRDILYSARGRQHPYCGPEPVEQWPSHIKYILDGMVWPEGDYVFHRRICTPTLLVHGLRDNKVSLVQECQMERTMVKAFLEAIPAAGHSPMTECPEQLNHMIHCFIDLCKNKK